MGRCTYNATVIESCGPRRLIQALHQQHHRRRQQGGARYRQGQNRAVFLSAFSLCAVFPRSLCRFCLPALKWRVALLMSGSEEHSKGWSIYACFDILGAPTLPMAPQDMAPHRAHYCRLSRFVAGVRFVDTDTSPSPSPAATAAALPATLDCRFGFVLLGGLYATDLLTLDQERTALDQTPSDVPQPALRGVTASNLAVSVEPGGSAGQQRLVLRLWADREGPFEADLTVDTGAGCEVGSHGSKAACT